MNIIKRIYRKIESKLTPTIKYLRKQGVKIGNNCVIYTREFGSEPYLIEIGDHVQITKDVKFFTHGGAWILRTQIPNFDTFGKIKIGNNVYIGNNALIMPGITVGDNVLIAAGSVVTKSIPTGYIVAGNPARKIGTYDEYIKKMEAYNWSSANKRNKKEILITNKSNNKFIVKDYLK